MPQLINKTKIYFYVLSFIFLTTILNQKFYNFLNKNFIIDQIEIKVETNEIKKKILNQTKYILNKNIFSLNSDQLISELYKLKFLEKFEIKKKYPKTVFINAKLTDLIAVSYIDQQKYFVGFNGEFIPSKNINNNKKLPVIFGNFKVKNFIELKSKLVQNGINHELIEKYYFHKNNRWDLHFSNNILLKLPQNEIGNALEIYLSFLSKNKIKKNSIIDLRISNRVIILNDQK
jgi:cell division protein FtsQ